LIDGFNYLLRTIARGDFVVFKEYILTVLFHTYCTDKNEIKIFLIYKEIHNGAVAKSYMSNGLLIYGEIFSHPYFCVALK
jgi:hypothetical protein